jgi:hypothetical protein
VRVRVPPPALKMDGFQETERAKTRGRGDSPSEIQFEILSARRASRSEPASPLMEATAATEIGRIRGQVWGASDAKQQKHTAEPLRLRRASFSRTERSSERIP